ncbi:MAG: ComF family protein [Ruminococcus sp.]|nr:ComF family protein [Ruminococcus sp.]
MSKFKKLVAAAFFPEHCPYCGDVVSVGKCACEKCGREFPETIRECSAVGGYLCTAPFSYTGIFAESVKSFKFRGHREYAEKLAEQINRAVSEAYKDISFDYITCVPMHKNQLKERGYNQSKLLGKKLSEITDIPYRDLLIKHKENLPQHTLSGLEKRDNVKGVYKALNTDIIKGHNILVIDDIITTGHTLGECCRILRKAGAKKICCATVCAKIIT